MPLSADAARLLADQIAHGHAWEEHRHEFPECDTRDDFALVIQIVLQNPTAERPLARRRRAFWHEEYATIVIASPADADGGTALRPDDGYRYFERVP